MNDSNSDLRSRLENSKKTIDGLEDNIANIEQKIAETRFNLNTFKDGWCFRFTCKFGSAIDS